MSKTNKRKNGESKNSNNNKEQKRQSVFDRLGTKESVNLSNVSLSVNTTGQDFCRNWAQNGTCPFGKSCKLSSTHILISPSKRTNKDTPSTSLKLDKRIEDTKRAVSTLQRRVGSPELNSWETWDQTELEYEDEKVLEKKRQLLQRELDLHMKKDTRKEPSAKIQRRSSSTSSCSSTTSGSSSSSVSSSESSAINRRSDSKKKKRSTSSPSGSERNTKKTRVKPSMSKESPPRKSSSSGGSKKLASPPRKRKKSSSTPPRKLPPPPSSPPKVRSSMTIDLHETFYEIIPEPKYLMCRRKDLTPERRGRGISTERKKHRSISRGRRRDSSPRPVNRRPRTPDSKLSSSSSSSRQPSSRNRTPDRKKDDDRKSKEDFRRGRKADYRDKRDVHEDSRSREKAREMREAAREKERSEALERCRERQREREAAAKEKERLREERERERKEAAAKRDRDRKDRRVSPRDRRRPVSQEPKRHVYDRYDRKVPDERERARDRALERVMERKSVERTRERGRDSYERSRRIIHEKPIQSPPYRCPEKRRYDTIRDGLASPEDRISSPYRCADKRGRYDTLRDGLSPREDRISPYRCNEKRGRYDNIRDGISPREDRLATPPYRCGDKRNRYEIRDGMSPREDRMRAGYSDGRRDTRRERASGGAWSGEGGSASSTRYEEPRDKSSSRGDWDIEFQDPTRRDWESRRSHVEAENSEIIKDKEENVKRHSRCSGDEIEEPKKPRIDEAQTSLQEELSDISDDADDILNREDIEFAECDEARLEDNEQIDHLDENSQPQQALTPERRGIERMAEDEGMVGLDFEEISDEELEEESKTNKGSVGDALGVDWSSLMAGCKEQRKTNGETSSARSYWKNENLLARIGISATMAGSKLFASLKEEYPGIVSDDDKKLSKVAALCRPLKEKKLQRENLISSTMQHKQALSARADLSIRRQLCGLPVVSLETHQNIGFCQWAV